MMDLSTLADEQYHKQNYLIRRNVDADNKNCYVYCSSNALYTNESQFRKRLVEGNYFEWLNKAVCPKAAVEIFIRDPYVCWYVKGIDSEHDNIDSICKLVNSSRLGGVSSL